ncbi:MAG: hypothetical protein LLF95_04555, partial [Bacteroidales bacterium]|nr:hypothetical protein [Bacteroidales bacterium]
YKRQVTYFSQIIIALFVYIKKPPYTERYVRWCERTVSELIAHFLLDFEKAQFRSLSNDE